MASRKKKTLAHGQFPLLVVTWQDAVADVGWSDTTELKTHTITSAGWKISENPTTIVLGSDISDARDETTKAVTTETNRRIAIPRDWITDIKEL